MKSEDAADERCCVISPESRLRDWPKMEHLRTRTFYGNNFGSKLQTNCSLILFGCTSFGGIQDKLLRPGLRLDWPNL